ncbi:MAG: CoA transferase [Gammaproteobacteria bacterium]|uniref:CoA transferase n=1 Tax=Vreelandella venusta TaxID=44935 RepID=A0ABX2BD95_9GAMM|nr:MULTISPECIES: CaiB/BaiF CoA-transferase family protein [Halomonas]MBR9925853.1 CoA transferase [Gammaproteobacteria bacterium]AZM97587.1 CoA transferase [Halomonas venusta]MDX1354328.1 CaiB/BaiF CoA-transferase family protein [Halomonas venusta]MDX1712187.1 CaiB/BaiF CoA-transferase family protein [Halomonas venusta]NPT31019.1 CoA transferase [Halomonas venusta]
MGALTGIRVLDLSRVLAGPWCSQVLADLGADVVKVERVGRGDDTRAWGPPYMKDAQGNETPETSYYQSSNRNKRSVAVDITTAKGQEVVRALAAESDVLVENFKAGSLKKYGLDYESLSNLNPRLIYCSITGFGQTGPRAQEPGYDFIIQGMGGLMSITGERDGVQGGGAQKVGVAVTDVMTGLYSVIAIQAALLAREKSGRGQHCDMALLDVQVAALGNQSQNYLSTGVSPGRYGNAHANIVPYNSFRASDKDFIIACGNDSQFAALSSAIGLPELSADPRFSKNESRVRNRDAITQILSEHFKRDTAEAWVKKISNVRVPVGLINDIADALAEPQVDARGMLVNIPHSLNPDFKMVGSPIHLSDTPVEYRRPAPLLGQDTNDVLTEYLGLSPEQLSQLKNDGVLG